MATTRRLRFLVSGLAVLAVGIIPAAAAPQLLFHWNVEAGISKAVVENSSDDVLAEYLWGGALPRRYSADEEEVEAPDFVLGNLRDQLEGSSQSEADEALDFIRYLMGAEADTPVAELSADQGTWIPMSSVTIQEWCGTVINAYGECTQPGNLSLQTALCSGFACKMTEIQPGE
jgi:hypothetical protein